MKSFNYSKGDVVWRTTDQKVRDSNCERFGHFAEARGDLLHTLPTCQCGRGLGQGSIACRFLEGHSGV
jgi:hypothetical protein